jgi:tetratricopeptide (TPR) repeat protein
MFCTGAQPMRAMLRRFVAIAGVTLVCVPATTLFAQQYNPGIVLDPLQPGNINRIFARERAEAESNYPQSHIVPQAEQFTYSQRARRAFQAGDYPLAASNWRHALIDEPGNGIAALRLAQAEFAMGNYQDATDAVQTGMTTLPYDQWGIVVKNYREFYPSNVPITNQLRALEKARKENPDNPAARFLLGYQYLYLGYPKHAETELQKAVELEPANEFSQKLAAVAKAATIAMQAGATTTGAPTLGTVPASAGEKSPAADPAAPPKKSSARPSDRPQINPPD